MTTAAIAKLLTDNLGNFELPRAVKRQIVGRNLESLWTDEVLDAAFTEAAGLAHQCAGLKQALPTNSELYDSQFTDAVRKIAEGIQQKIELTP